MQMRAGRQPACRPLVRATSLGVSRVLLRTLVQVASSKPDYSDVNIALKNIAVLE